MLGDINFIFYHFLLMQEIPSSGLVECEKTNLECPISQLKMVEPVILPGCLERFDKNSVMEKIKGEPKVTVHSVASTNTCRTFCGPDMFLTLLFYHDSVKANFFHLLG